MLELIQAAGWPIWLLVATSVLGLALVIERFLSLRAGVVFPARLPGQASITAPRPSQRRGAHSPFRPARRPCAGRGLDEPPKTTPTGWQPLKTPAKTSHTAPPLLPALATNAVSHHRGPVATVVA